jgi:thiosulfate dehydrogenase
MLRRIATLLPLAVLLDGCRAGQSTDEVGQAGAPAGFDEASWNPPTEADIPADSLGVSIRRGLHLLRFTPESLPQYATSAMRCTSCHQQDGVKRSAGSLAGVYARFPQYLNRTGAVIGLPDRINYCFTRSLAGNALPTESREMIDILAYLAFISRGVPGGLHLERASMPKMPVELEGVPERGREIYVQRGCNACHGANGEGAGALPPLWGPQSFAIAASMARIERAATFIYHNMPQTAPMSLSHQEAWDLAAYITSQPRPDSPGKEDDWPVGGSPSDVPYDLASGHRAFRPPPLLPRATPERALVPVPPRAQRAAVISR